MGEGNYWEELREGDRETVGKESSDATPTPVVKRSVGAVCVYSANSIITGISGRSLAVAGVSLLNRSGMILLERNVCYSRKDNQY